VALAVSAAAPAPVAPAMLSGELAPALLHADAAVIVFTLGTVQVIDTAPDGIETGLLHGAATTILRASSGGPAASAALLVPFSRAQEPLARVRQGFNLWNTLDLAPGARLVLVGHAVPGDTARFVAEAGAAIAGDGAAMGRDLRQALEQAADPPRTARGLRGALAAALAGHDAISRDVLLAQASEGPAIARLPAIEALLAVLRDTPAGTDARLLIGVLSSPRLYDSELGADSGNALVLGGLAARLPQAGADGDLVILTLAGCLLGRFDPDPARDAAIRHRLASEAFGDPPALAALVRRVAAPLGAPVRERAAALAAVLGH
jgi:hypothetical protein